MANFWDQIGGLGEGILEAGGDLITGIGDSFEATGIADKARAQAILINAQIAAQRAAGEQERKAQQMQLLQNVLYISIGGILLLTTAKYVVLPLVKK